MCVTVTIFYIVFLLKFISGFLHWCLNIKQYLMEIMNYVSFLCELAYCNNDYSHK